jgi:hypothetical protein
VLGALLLSALGVGLATASTAAGGAAIALPASAASELLSSALLQATLVESHYATLLAAEGVRYGVHF